VVAASWCPTPAVGARPREQLGIEGDPITHLDHTVRAVGAGVAMMHAGLAVALDGEHERSTAAHIASRFGRGETARDRTRSERIAGGVGVEIPPGNDSNDSRTSTS
jgi:hypothetical protein